MVRGGNLRLEDNNIGIEQRLVRVEWHILNCFARNAESNAEKFPRCHRGSVVYLTPRNWRRPAAKSSRRFQSFPPRVLRSTGRTTVDPNAVPLTLVIWTALMTTKSFIYPGLFFTSIVPPATFTRI